jgi:hypothetical protein
VEDLIPHRLGIRAEIEQDPSSDTFVLPHEAEQDVLSPDVIVTERKRLSQRELEHLLRARCERNLAGCDLVALTDDPRDLSAHLFDGDVEGVENLCRSARLLPEEAEQDVLGADVVVVELPGLLLREDDCLTRTLGEALEHA